MNRYILLLFFTATTFTGFAQAPGGKSPLSKYSKEWDNPKYSVCNTAAKASFMSDTEKQMVYIINLVRVNPGLFYKTILPRASKISVFADTSKDAFKAMAKMLREMKPMPLIYPDSFCYVHAHCHATVCGAKGLVTSDDQPECEKKHYKSFGQSDHYGSTSPLAVVLSLMEMSSPFLGKYSKIAVARAPHKEYTTMTVVEVANDKGSGGGSGDWETPKYDAGKCPLITLSPKWGLAKYKVCNTAANAPYLSDREKQIIYILNLARMDPQLFCETVVKKARTISGFIDTSNAQYYKSLVAEMKAMKPLPVLTPDSLCYVSANCHATTSGAKGQVGHTREDGDCKGITHFSGECCQYGIGDPLGIIINLLVDQNVESLGHRHICLGKYNKMSPSVAHHKGYGVVAVLDFY